MDDCTCYIGLCHACAYDGLYDAGIYAGYADNRNSKELVYCEKKESHLRNLGWFSGYACGSFSDQVSEQQSDRISDCTFTGYFFRWWRGRLFHRNATFILAAE